MLATMKQNTKQRSIRKLVKREHMLHPRKLLLKPKLQSLGPKVRVKNRRDDILAQ